jgi:hypothetical protein
LRFRREGRADGHAKVAVMDAQAAQPDQAAARSVTLAFRHRPASEPLRRPFGCISGNHFVALAAGQHAVLEKLHHARIGVKHRQAIGVGQGDRLQIETVGDDAMVQDGSLPVPVSGL